MLPTAPAASDQVRTLANARRPRLSNTRYGCPDLNSASRLNRLKSGHPFLFLKESRAIKRHHPSGRGIAAAAQRMRASVILAVISNAPHTSNAATRGSVKHVVGIMGN